MVRNAWRRERSARIELAFASAVALLALPGCPISDDYFVDPNAGADGAASGSGGSDGMGGKGGKTPKGSGGSGAGAGATGGGLAGGGSGGDAGGGGSGGGTPPECEEPCNAPRTCTNGCQDGWITTSTPPGGFSPRQKAAYTSIGSQFFIWGGVNESGTALNSGALYDPRYDSWTTVANDANTPTPRSLATAVWTGSVVVVWGGLDPVSMQPLSDGAIWDPVRDAWSPMSLGPTARAAAVGAVVSEQVVFFGGQGAQAAPLDDLDAYDLDLDVWEPGMENSPPAVADPAAAGGSLTFWTHGGRTEMNSGVPDSTYYSMSSDRWVASESLSPGRWGAFSAFTDSFYVWGGRDLNDLFDDGASHSPGGFNWQSMESRGAPSVRYATDRESGWTFVMNPETSDEGIVIIAGLDAPGSYLTDGAIYGTNRDDWTAITAWPSQATHAFDAAGLAAGELIVWGGRDGRDEMTLTNQGVRYRPPD